MSNLSRPLKISLAVILAAAAAGWAAIWWLSDGIRQAKVTASLGVGAVLVALLLIWLLFASRRIFLVAFAVLVLAGLLVEIKGVSGDLMPILGWRWSDEPAAVADVAPLPKAAGEATAGWEGEDDDGEQVDRASGGQAEAIASEDEESPQTPSGPLVADGATAARAITEPAAEPGAEPGETAPLPVASDAAPAPKTDDLPGAFPQFQGPRRDATFPSIRLARDWKARPPKRLWQREVGAGWSGFAVVDDAAVTQEQRGEEELVVRYDLATGEPVWVHSDRARYATTIGGVGPRATPTIVGDRVYSMGATGLLNCLDLATGERYWGINAIEENGGSVPSWGKSGSPLVVGDLVVVSAGGNDGRSLVAYDRWSGELAWSGGDDPMSYASPMLVRLGGRDQIVVFNQPSLAGHDPATGRLLWRFPWPAQQPNVSQPIVLPEDRLFASSGYGTGGKLLRFAPDGEPAEPELVWESRRLKAKFTDVVFHDGYLYGLDDGILVCLDPATGERCWKRGRYGHGQSLLVGNLLLVLGEHGTVHLVEPTPEEHRELASLQVLDGKSWNFPTLAGNLLLVRNDREAALWELPVAQ